MGASEHGSAATGSGAWAGLGSDLLRAGGNQMVRYVLWEQWMMYRLWANAGWASGQPAAWGGRSRQSNVLRHLSHSTELPYLHEVP